MGAGMNIKPRGVKKLQHIKQSAQDSKSDEIGISPPGQQR
jgi:hypothetical protein